MTLQQVLNDAYIAARNKKIVHYVFKNNLNDYYFLSAETADIEKTNRPCIKVFPHGVYVSLEEGHKNGDFNSR